MPCLPYGTHTCDHAVDMLVMIEAHCLPSDRSHSAVRLTSLNLIVLLRVHDSFGDDPLEIAL